MLEASLGRWVVKKSARAVVAAAGAGALVVPRREPSVRALTYHRFGSSRRDPFRVPAAVFAAQMRWLARSGRAVSLRHLEGFLGGAPLPDRAVLVTIDDGDASTFEIALPILRQYDLPAVAYVIANEVGQPGYMTAAQLRELDGTIDIGSHSLSHRSMARLPATEAVHEARHSRHLLETMLDRPVESFAYPYGTRLDFADHTAAILAEAGYRTAFTSQHGAIRSALPPLVLPRIKVEGKDPGWIFPALCAGAMDGWRLIDNTMWRLQKPLKQRVRFGAQAMASRQG
jgi:peptidoglycan/xylan/chitin deacetylase (PgdA/CDA1 family)